MTAATHSFFRNKALAKKINLNGCGPFKRCQYVLKAKLQTLVVFVLKFGFPDALCLQVKVAFCLNCGVNVHSLWSFGVGRRLVYG